MTLRTFRSFLVLSLLVPIGTYLYTLYMATTTKAEGAIVVGSGLAGLSAALQLISHGVPVRLLDRAAKPGGNSIKASSGINAAPTRFQTVPDAAFYDDTIRSAGSAFSSAREQREKLISTLVKDSASAVYWLNDEKGIDLSVVAQLGGHTVPRTHRPAKSTVGASIVITLLNQLKESSLFQLETEARVTRVLKAGERVTGVEYTCEGETKELLGPVVFATGGFAGDAQGLLATYRPDLAGYPSTNDPREGTQSLLTEVGAQLLDMDMVQVHPTGFVDPKAPASPLKFLAAEILRGEGGLLLMDGKRFVNEMETRQHITNAITKHQSEEGEVKQWDVQVVLDEGTYHAAETHLGFYLWKGLMRKTTVGELGAVVQPSIQEYADAASGRTVDLFGRTAFGHWTLEKVEPDSVVYVGKVTPVVHFTMGGVVISEKSEVLDEDGKAIPGLWAAGEITGGIHGENRLGGSSLLECVVFGRIAGDQAAEAFKSA
ncbi:Flavocytochrome c [Peniophora sp. CONT]|nr:Flavocytochrome c [Peniophora sp. CONT]